MSRAARFSPMLFIAILLAFNAPVQAQEFDLSTPRKAWATLEAAYQRKDVETMIACHDYETEARMIFNTFFDERANDEYLKKGIDPIDLLVNDMVSKVRREQRDNTGYPLRGNPVCSITGEQQLQANIVELQQHCVYAGRGDVSPRLRFKWNGKQWRLFDVLWENSDRK